MNKTIILGNLTKEPELMETSNGTAYCNFAVAVNGESNDAEGNRPTYFYPCIAWKQRAENLVKYCGKGSKVLVEGEMQSRNYEDKDGIKRTAWSLVANKIEFVGSRKQDDEEVVSMPKQSRREQMTQIDDDNQLPF